MSLQVAPVADDNTSIRNLQKGFAAMALESGDHIWYYDGKGNPNAIAGEQVSKDGTLPRLDWFPNANPSDDNDYSNNGIHIFAYVLYDTEIRQGQPQLIGAKGSWAWLNNNPGNLTADRNDYGQIPGKRSWHNFFVFPDADTGFAAIRPWLVNNGYLGKSILATFKSYAPNGDGKNSPDTYAANVANAAGVSTDKKLQDLSDDEWQLLLNGIQQVEGTVEGQSFAYNDPSLPQVVVDRVSEL
jgi:hypothetical protein